MRARRLATGARWWIRTDERPAHDAPMGSQEKRDDMGHPAHRSLTDRLHGLEAEIAAGRAESALPRCQELATRYPRALAVQRVLGELYLALRKPREALAALDRALAGDPEDARACCARAIVHQLHGDQLAALGWYRRACDIRPEDLTIRATYRELAGALGQPAYQPGRVGLARLYLRGDLFTHAVREWETLIVENADSVRLEAYVGLVETLWRAGRAPEAAAWARRALTNAPACLKPLLIAGVVAHDEGRAAEAEPFLRRARDLDPEQRVARALFADRLGAGDAALSALLGGLREGEPPLADGGDRAGGGETGASSAPGAPGLAPASGQRPTQPAERRINRPLVTGNAGDTGALSLAHPDRTAPPAPPAPPLSPPAARPNALPPGFHSMFKETEGMLWKPGDSDPATLRETAMRGAATATLSPAPASVSEPTPFPMPAPAPLEMTPPAIAESGFALGDTEMRRAIRWVQWLQAQGARSFGYKPWRGLPSGSLDALISNPPSGMGTAAPDHPSASVTPPMPPATALPSAHSRPLSRALPSEPSPPSSADLRQMLVELDPGARGQNGAGAGSPEAPAEFAAPVASPQVEWPVSLAEALSQFDENARDRTRHATNAPVTSGRATGAPAVTIEESERLSVQVAGITWGWLPAISLSCSLGLLLIATANNAARVGAGWSAPLYWVSLLVLYLPVALRLLARDVSRSERMALVTLVGVALYLVKVLLSPIAPSLHDEFLHWRTALDIAQTHHLFSPNPLYDVSAYYPGLEIVVNAVSSLSGLSLFGSGVLVLGVARVMFVLALYMVYEMIGRSARLAGLATLFYMANPNFVYFDAQFAYESLALPLAVVALYFAIRRYRQRRGFTSLFTIAAIGLTAALVVTHHMTSYALFALLVVWCVVQVLGRPGWRQLENQALRWYAGESTGQSFLHEARAQLAAIRQLRNQRAHTPHARRSVGDLAFVTLFLITIWLLTAGRQALVTLGPILIDDVVNLFQLLAAQESSRTLFQTATGQIDPLWSRLLGYGSVALILVTLPFGLWQVWQRYRTSALAVTLGLAALGYPLSLALRLTHAGVETSNRLSEILFVALGFVLAAALVNLDRPQWPPLERALHWAQTWTQTWTHAPALHPLGWRAVFAAAVAVLFLGGLVVGMPPYDLQPGPFHVASDARSNNQQSMLAAEWARTHLNPHTVMYTDLTNKLYQATYGAQNPIGHPLDIEELQQLMNSSTFDAAMQRFLSDNHIKYLVIDSRLSTGLPWAGYYFESDPNEYNYRRPISPAGLSKFAHVPSMSRIYDNGTIVIYDVGSAPATSGKNR